MREEIDAGAPAVPARPRPLPARARRSRPRGRQLMDFNKLTIKSPGGGRGGAGAGAPPAATPSSTPSTCCSRCSTRSCRASWSSDPDGCAPRPSSGFAERPRISRARSSSRRSRARFSKVLDRGGRRGAEARGRVRLDRAPAARARRRPARRAAREDQGGARRPARHLAGSRGHLPGAREVRPRPDRGGRAGQARPGRSAATRRSAA